MNKKTKRVIVSLISTLSFLAHVNAQEVSYKILKDDPYDINNLNILITPFYCDAWMQDITVGGSVRGDLFVKKIMTLNFDIRKALFDFNAFPQYDKTLPVPDKIKALFYAEIGANLNISDKAEETTLSIVTTSHSQQSGNIIYTTSNYFNTTGKYRKINQLRGGFFYIKNPIDIDDDIGKNFIATNIENPNDTFRFGGYGVIVDSSAIYGGTLMMKNLTLYAGIGMKRITNLVTYVDGYGERDNAHFFDMYFDFMYMPLINFGTVRTVGGKEWKVTNSELKKMGWRIGLAHYFVRRRHFAYKIETGMRPSYKPDGNIFRFYALLNLEWVIRFKVKSLLPESYYHYY